MSSPGDAVQSSVRALLREWAVLWEMPGLEDAVAVRFSTRLRRSLGRCRPAAGRVTLSAELVSGAPEALAEVLCHEAAHVVNHRRHGRAARTHGPEWRALVRAAGFEPRVHARTEADRQAVAGDVSPAHVPSSSRPTRRAERPPVYEHRCPVCHAVRFARRPVPAWRCAECRDAGLEGTLIITQHAQYTESGR